MCSEISPVPLIVTFEVRFIRHLSLISSVILNFMTFYIRGPVHRDSILIRSNTMQQYAGVYLLQNYSTCFGCLSQLSSGVHQTVTAASGTGHSVRATTIRQLGQ